MIDRNEVLALAGKVRKDRTHFASSEDWAAGYARAKQEDADQIEALAAKAEPQGGEVVAWRKVWCDGRPDIWRLMPVPEVALEDVKRGWHAIEYATHPAPKPAEGEVTIALLREASAVLESVAVSGVPLPNNWRWPLVDELSGAAALLAAAPKKGE